LAVVTASGTTTFCAIAPPTIMGLAIIVRATAPYIQLHIMGFSLHRVTLHKEKPRRSRA
jgi:hypothetical protein